MSSQLLVTTNKLTGSLFWHTFQNRILSYIPHFFFVVNPNSWQWITKNNFAESLWNIHCCCCCVITRRAEADDYLWHAINTHNHPNAGKSHGWDAPPHPPVPAARLWQWLMAARTQTVLGAASVTGERRQFIPSSPSAVNNNLRKGWGLITQSLPGWGRETAVSMYADGRPSLVLVARAERGRREHSRVL